MKRALAVLGALAIAPASLAATTFGHGHVRIAPPSGQPTTTFRVGFTTPERTGVQGSMERHDLLSASAPSGKKSCIQSIGLRTPDGAAGERVHMALRPGRLGGTWCTGTYSGQIEEIQTAVCPHGEHCPAYVLLRGVVGRFTFRVTTRDTTAPRFAGLERAFACTPGPQRPGQTTPYTLSWTAASDNQTPSSQLVYEVYYATHSGAEDFHTPSWTTTPGVTSFRTPGLPSHGAAYFVVRARDRAGNEDHNTVERRGTDPCL